MFTANVECPHRTWKGSLLMLSMLWTFSSSLDGRQNYLQASCIQRSHTGMATLRLTMQQQPSLLYSVSNDNKDFSIILGVRVPLPCPFYFPCSLARHRPAVKLSSSQPPTLARLRPFLLTICCVQHLTWTSAANIHLQTMRVKFTSIKALQDCTCNAQQACELCKELRNSNTKVPENNSRLRFVHFKKCHQHFEQIVKWIFTRNIHCEMKYS